MSYAEVLRVEALSLGVYGLPAGAEDRQQPHTEDEVYVVLRGRAQATAGAQALAVAPGSVPYVPAGVAHRFHDIARGPRRPGPLRPVGGRRRHRLNGSERRARPPKEP